MASISEKGDGHGCKKVRVAGMMENQEAVDSLIPDGCASQLRQGTVFSSALSAARTDVIWWSRARMREDDAYDMSLG